MSEATTRRVRAVAAAALAALLATPAAAQLQSVTSARQLQGERTLDAEIRFGAGRLRVEPGRENMLYRMELRYDDRVFRPLTDYDRASGRLRLGTESLRRRGETRLDHEQRATISLSPSVSTELDLEFGAGEAEVELGGMALESLDLSTGASETVVSFSRPNRVEARTVRVEAGAAEIRVEKLGNARAERFVFKGGVGEATLDFTGAWSRSATASIDMGLGSVRLRFPRGLGVRIVKDSFLASFEHGGMVRRGNAWYSRGYDEAAVKLDMEIDAALGSIEVEWVDGR
ncbi:MAG TPA: hypothetical protein VHG91_21285 [Longimicrobium sp.]|nr:hypothetical protein [Longimicrobium sp.]